MSDEDKKKELSAKEKLRIEQIEEEKIKIAGSLRYDRPDIVVSKLLDEKYAALEEHEKDKKKLLEIGFKEEAFEEEITDLKAKIKKLESTIKGMQTKRKK